MSNSGTPRLDLSPSAADRWTVCTASPQFIFQNWEKIPPQDTQWSTEGTTAHEIAAAMLLGRKPILEECPAPITPEMHKHAFRYWEYVQELREHGSEMFVEQKFPLWYMPNRNAKIDVAIKNPNGLHIVDLKYGQGIVVPPFENVQCAIYARATIDNLFKTSLLAPDLVPWEFPITIHIYQPRGRAAEDAPFHFWETTWGEIYDFTEERVSEPAQDILVGGLFTENNLKFVPTEKTCQWCPFKNPTPDGFFCNARRAAMTADVPALATFESGIKHLMTPGGLSAKQLSAILDYGDEIIDWIEESKKYALQFMCGGGKLPGWKVVTSRGGNRNWTNPALAAKLLLETHLRRDEVFQESVISVAQAETLLGKNKFSVSLTNLIRKTPGVPTIARAEDSRPERNNPAALFENVSTKSASFF